MEGIALAKKRGAYKGRKPALTQEKIDELRIRIAKGDKKSHIAKDLGISRETLYQYLKKIDGNYSQSINVEGDFVHDQTIFHS